MTFTLIVTDRTGGLANEKAEMDSVQGGISGECPGEDKGSAVPNAPGHAGIARPLRMAAMARLCKIRLLAGRGADRGLR